MQQLGRESGFVYSTFLSAKEGQNISEPMQSVECYFTYGKIPSVTSFSISLSLSELIRSMLEQKQSLAEDKLTDDKIPGESLRDISSKDAKCCYSGS